MHILPAVLNSLQFSYPGLVLQRKQLLRGAVECFVSDTQVTLAESISTEKILNFCSVYSVHLLPGVHTHAENKTKIVTEAIK